MLSGQALFRKRYSCDDRLTADDDGDGDGDGDKRGKEERKKLYSAGFSRNYPLYPRKGKTAAQSRLRN